MSAVPPLLEPPHGFPFRFVDRVAVLEQGSHAVAIRAVTFNDALAGRPDSGESFFPSIFLIEACSQAAGLVEPSSSLKYLAGVDSFEFDCPVRFGDRLTISARLEKRMGRISKFQCEVSCEGRICARGFIFLSDLAHF